MLIDSACERMLSAVLNAFSPTMAHHKIRSMGQGRLTVYKIETDCESGKGDILRASIKGFGGLVCDELTEACFNSPAAMLNLFLWARCVDVSTIDVC